jgi:hypothetical protein
MVSARVDSRIAVLPAGEANAFPDVGVAGYDSNAEVVVPVDAARLWAAERDRLDGYVRQVAAAGRKEGRVVMLSRSEQRELASCETELRGDKTLATLARELSGTSTAPQPNRVHQQRQAESSVKPRRRWTAVCRLAVLVTVELAFLLLMFAPLIAVILLSGGAGAG